MCLIIETKKEITIPRFVMEDMFERNNDGFGFMYVRNGHSYGEKYHSSDLDLLYNTYLRLKDCEPFIHLRMKTHGDISEENSHPYNCGSGVWLMHNGVMGECQGDDKSKSDTWYFANEYLRPMFEQVMDVSAFIRTRGFKELVTRFIGSNNRIVLADRVGTLRFNPSSWHTITNEQTKCVGMRVSNTYAWSLYKKSEPVSYGKYEPAYHRQRTTIPGNSSPTRLPSKEGDPAGSFRDLQDELWLYNGTGWIKSYNGIGFIGSQGATQNPPTFPSNNESGSKSNIIVLGNGTSSEPNKTDSSPPWNEDELADDVLDQIETERAEKVSPELNEEWREMYFEWLCDQFQELDYKEIYRRVKEQPDEAADFIALHLEKTINHDLIDQP